MNRSEVFLDLLKANLIAETTFFAKMNKWKTNFGKKVCIDINLHFEADFAVK